MEAPVEAPGEAIDWVAADWGTSRLRLWAMSADGRRLARRESDQGMGRLSRAGFEPALRAALAGWIPTGRALPVLACGMVGSRQGWIEVPYRDLPAAPGAAGALAAPPVTGADLDVRIAPGLRQTAPPDVMRGEETQVAGLIAEEGLSEGIVCLPGTHSKWVRLEGGRIAAFRTAMTGELFALLSDASVLRHSLASGPETGPGPESGPAPVDHPAFAAAVQEMSAAPGELISALFSIRAAALVEARDADAPAGRARLSGLLIGAELAAMRRWWAEAGQVIVIGAPEIGAAYLAALGQSGARAVLRDGEEMALAGLVALRAANGKDMS